MPFYWLMALIAGSWIRADCEGFSLPLFIALTALNLLSELLFDGDMNLYAYPLSCFFGEAAGFCSSTAEFWIMILILEVYWWEVMTGD